MVTITREAAQQMLELAKKMTPLVAYGLVGSRDIDQAERQGVLGTFIATLQAAIDAPPVSVAVPVAWRRKEDDTGNEPLYAAPQPPVSAAVPYAYAVYFPDQPCEELIHNLDDLIDNMTKREHSVTPLYTYPSPVLVSAKPLTDDVMFALINKHFYAGMSPAPSHYLELGRSVETAHGISGEPT